MTKRAGTSAAGASADAGVASAWLVVTSAAAESERFVVIASSLVEAAARAISVASARPGGPWAVQAVQFVGELAS